MKRLTNTATSQPFVTAKTMARSEGRQGAWGWMLNGLMAGGLIAVVSGFAAMAQETTTTHAFSNYGDVKYPADMTHLDFVNPDAPKGGEISIGAIGAFDSFNRFARKGQAEGNSDITAEGVLVSLPDDPFGMYCFLCETMEYPEDLSWIAFNLRDDVTFADGTPMTAEDVAFSFNLFLEQGLSEYRRIVEGFIQAVEVEGPHRIKFTFTETAPRNERVGFAGATTPVFSKAWFEKTGQRLDDSAEVPFMGTGPYVLGSKDFGRQVVYTRNPNYWGSSHPLQIGRNNFDSIRTEYFGDSQAAFEGFKGGAFTFRVETSSKDWATGYDFPAIENGSVIKATFPDGNVGAATNFVFNLDRPMWQDIRVREALGLMFNFEWSNDALFYGLYKRVDSFWPGTDMAATGTPTEGELAILQPLVEQGLLPETILTDEAVVPPVNDAAQNRPARSVLRKASALLDAAGWEIGEDGMRRKDGKTLDATFLSYSPTLDRVINPIVENMQFLGVNAALNRVDTSQYIERRRAGDFDITGHGIAMVFEPGIGLEQWFASKTADNSSRNIMRLRDPAVDALIPPVVLAPTLEDMKAGVRAFDRALRTKMIGIPQWYKPEHTVAFYDTFGYPDTIAPLDLGYLDYWWFDAEKREALRASGALR
ncbi:MAG: extracellular solute-binding protein [Maritimibacter sp.]